VVGGDRGAGEQQKRGRKGKGGLQVHGRSPPLLGC
jgi:hypothetical protein